MEEDRYRLGLATQLCLRQFLKLSDRSYDDQKIGENVTIVEDATIQPVTYMTIREYRGPDTIRSLEHRRRLGSDLLHEDISIIL